MLIVMTQSVLGMHCIDWFDFISSVVVSILLPQKKKSDVLVENLIFYSSKLTFVQFADYGYRERHRKNHSSAIHDNVCVCVWLLFRFKVQTRHWYTLIWPLWIQILFSLVGFNLLLLCNYLLPTSVFPTFPVAILTGNMNFCLNGYF